MEENKDEKGVAARVILPDLYLLVKSMHQQ